MNQIKRILIIILDGVGIGELPDASRFGDEGSNTLGNIAEAVGGLNLPNLEKMGLGNIASLKGMKPQSLPTANYGKMGEISPGKDSTTGHWEIGGIHLDFDFPYYPNGFPAHILDEFSRLTGRGVLGNKPASGTEIIKELGEEHIKTGKLIVYTSADSVFQIAAHEEIIPVDELYRICKIARSIMTGENAVARVIARPFIGDNPENFIRTRGRRDFSLKPTKPTLLNLVQAEGIKTIGIGKIDDLYAGEGLDVKLHSKSNQQGIELTLEQLRNEKQGLIMVNLVDFDMLWGHRNHIQGFYDELQAFDRRLPEILNLVDENTILFISADHGNDPTTASTDHAREYVPLLVQSPGIKRGINLGTRTTFADLGMTVTHILGADPTSSGMSFWDNIKKF